ASYEPVGKLERPIGDAFGHRSWIWTVVYSPDGQKILTGSEDMTVQLWDARKCLPLALPLWHSDKILTAAFSRDGKMLATGSPDNKAYLWDMSPLKQIGDPLLHFAPVQAVGFARDDRSFVTSTQLETRRWISAVNRRPTGIFPHPAAVAAA